MAIKYLNNREYTLTKGAAGAILYEVGTDEAQAILKATTGNFGAVNAGTTAAKVTGGDTGVLYRLTVNAADTAATGPVVFESKGATDTTYIYARVVEAQEGELKTGAIAAATFAAGAIDATAIANSAIDAATFAAGAIDATAIADDAIAAAKIATGAFTSDAFAAGALVEGVFGAGAINAAAIKDAAIDAATFAAGAINAAAIATDAIDDDAIATGAIASTAFAAGAITAAAIATDAIGAAELAADAVVEIAAGVTTIATAGTLRHVYFIQHNEATAAKRTFMVDVPTADTQTVTISRNGGAYAPCASGTACTQVTGTEYKLVLALADCSTVGTMRVKCTGSGAGVQITDFVVCEYDPYTAGASTTQEMKYRAS